MRTEKETRSVLFKSNDFLDKSQEIERETERRKKASKKQSENESEKERERESGE